MEKRYTMKEFKKMYDDIQIEVIECLEKEMLEAQERLGEELSAMGRMTYTMQNLFVLSILRDKLFGEDDE